MEAFLISLLVQVGVTSLSAFALAGATGKLEPWIAWVSFAGGLVAAIFAHMEFRKEEKPAKNSRDLVTDSLVFAVVFFAYSHFHRLFYFAGGSWRTLDRYNYGDLPLHVTYIRNFASGAKFWPDNPFFAGSRLGYPFGMDLYNALFEILGMELSRHLFLTGFALTIAALFFLHRWLGWLGVGAFFFNGGWPGVPLVEPVLQWKNFFLSLLVTQRGFLFAIPVGALLLSRVWRFARDGESLCKCRLPWLLFLYGVLPLFHVHTFIAVTLIGGTMLLLKKQWKPILFSASAWPLALILILILTGGGEKASMVHLGAGWALGQTPWWEFWFMNLGPWLFFLGWIIWESIEGTAKEFRNYALAMAGFFVLFNFVIMAAWDWDNIKLLVWFYLAILAVGNHVIQSRLENRGKWRWAVPLLAVLLFGEGFWQVSKSVYLDDELELYKEEEIAAVQGAPLPAGAVIASSLTFNHPLSYWGHTLVNGYPGHIWSHGIAQDGRDQDLKRAFQGEMTWKEFTEKYKSKFTVTHVSWGKMEDRDFPNGKSAAWRNELKPIWTEEGAMIYEIPK